MPLYTATTLPPGGGPAQVSSLYADSILDAWRRAHPGVDTAHLEYLPSTDVHYGGVQAQQDGWVYSVIWDTR